MLETPIPPIRHALCAVALMGAALCQAGTTLSLAWQTPAVFKTPESVLPDADGEHLFVSNINGDPMVKDGNGFISLLVADGSTVSLDWVGGLDAPTGMARVGRHLFVADVDTLVEIDIDSAKVVARYVGEGAQFLNDVAAGNDGAVYVTDLLANRIYRLKAGVFSVWLASDALANPNGVTVHDDALWVASWGVMTPGSFSTEVPGHLLRVPLDVPEVMSVGDGSPVGNLDGIEAMADGSLLVTDWMAGGLMRIRPDGTVTRLDALAPGSADIGYDARRKVVYVPMMKDGTVKALSLVD